MVRRIIRLEDLADEDFVGPDRLNSWRITQEDLDRIVANLKKVSDTPRVLNVGCDLGIFSYLLAKEGCYVIGIDKPVEGKEKKDQEKKEKRHKYWQFLKKKGLKNLRLIEGSIGELYKDPDFNQVDAVYCSWMPMMKNFSLLFYRDMKVPMVIHVIGESKEYDVNDNEYDKNENRVVTGFFPQGDLRTEAMFKDVGSPYQIARYPGYKVLDAWMVPDSRTVGRSPQRLSKIRVDVRKELNIK